MRAALRLMGLVITLTVMPLVAVLAWSRMEAWLIQKEYRELFAGVSGVKAVIQFSDYETKFATLELEEGRITVDSFDERSFSTGGAIVVYSIDDLEITCRLQRWDSPTGSFFNVAGDMGNIKGLPIIRNFHDLIRHRREVKNFVETNLSQGADQARPITVKDREFWCYFDRTQPAPPVRR